MSDKAYLLLSPHIFKVILDIKKTKKFNILHWLFLDAKDRFTRISITNSV